MEFRFSTGTVSDIELMRSLIFNHGPNQWNYLPIDGIEHELQDVLLGRAKAVLCEHEDKLIGLAIFYPSFVRFPHLISADIDSKKIAYIEDVVVHKENVGKGIGATMLGMVIGELQGMGAELIFIDCHDENVSSRKMMHKVGFQEAGIFKDPQRRSVGTQQTWVGVIKAS